MTTVTAANDASSAVPAGANKSYDHLIREQRKERARREFFHHASINPTRYRILSVMGEGAFGVVCKAVDGVAEQAGQRDCHVAIKRIRKVMDTPPMATRVLREMKFLRLLGGHENIVGIKDILVPGEASFNDAFVVFELMDADLATVLRSKTVLTPNHIKYFLFQLLKALAFMHESNVMHRDLKPGNLLVNRTGTLKVCDLGLARAAFELPDPMNLWTDYVATRWYRAPELILNPGVQYSSAIDMWSVGCIFAEMLSRGMPLFPGASESDQIALIVRVTGRPSPQIIEAIRDPNTRQYMRSVPIEPQAPLENLFAANGEICEESAMACDLLRRFLAFNPLERITATQALAHPYFGDFRKHGSRRMRGTPVPPEEFAFESVRETGELRMEFLKEVALYHPECADLVVSPQDNYRVSQVQQAVQGMPDATGVAKDPIRNTMPNHNFRYHAKRTRDVSTLNEEQLSRVTGIRTNP
eukprot:CAMPEP_0198323438 /NCGR_PEP_ID=MMETSP1450-20131203/11680_1 /TAXON_ID=753684 ORGANISM="Madagascaria erythrocladiodes, Strain CCMP3234" /NCGR_SAMPLE_ID=MMETSP1450 /ASSEMBLY_ACC=CAM_ASM_001115 /LENGTH=471 /DNA_ID=CAMNT_0044027141 /DNA_START=112 /DNA_END=1527 /DNA_ORIENTATION=+